MLFDCLVGAFLKDEDGAVTVDWVMLTSGIVLLGVTVVGFISSALSSTANGIGDVIESSTNALT